MLYLQYQKVFVCGMFSDFGKTVIWKGTSFNMARIGYFYINVMYIDLEYEVTITELLVIEGENVAHPLW